jgi:hypothetical protein
MDLNFTLIPIGLLLFFLILLFPFLVKLHKRLCPPARTRSLQRWFEYAIVGSDRSEAEGENESVEDGEVDHCECLSVDRSDGHMITILSETDGEQNNNDGTRERTSASKLVVQLHQPSSLSVSGSLTSSVVRSLPSSLPPQPFARQKTQSPTNDSTGSDPARTCSPSLETLPPSSSSPVSSLHYLRPLTPPDKPSSIPVINATSQVINYNAALDLTFTQPSSSANRVSSRAVYHSSRPSSSPSLIDSQSSLTSHSASHSRKNSNSHVSSSSNSSGRTKMSKSALHSHLASMPLHRSAELPRANKHTPIRLNGDSRRSSFSHPSGEIVHQPNGATLNEAKGLLQNLLAITRMGSISPLSPPMFSYEPEVEELEPL